MSKVAEIRVKKQVMDTSCCLTANSSSSTFQEDAITNNNNLIQPKHGNREYSFPKKDRISVQFTDLKYTVAAWSFKAGREHKEILHNISGEFRAGKLTAIMGPSGAGKSTLLNVLAGYTTHGTAGEVLVNNKVRDLDEFSAVTCYIQQEDKLRAMLTARELMVNTAHLKLGNLVTTQYKLKQVQASLLMLGLEECQDTRCGLLSGGQKKRLSIALELISDPPVLFLDEPTTGLDSSSCSQCVSLLKMLARDGRTIICTIHQPSALVFEMFDHLYALSEGRCIYQGAVKNLLPHLEKFGLQCPNYHNPADFLLDVSMGEYGADIAQLAEAAQLADIAQLHDRSTLTSVQVDQTSHDIELKNGLLSNGALTNGTLSNGALPMYKISDGQIHIKMKKTKESRLSSPASSLLMQFYLLYCRNLTTISRDSSRILVRLGAHLLIGLIFGYLYRGVGNNASTVLGNSVFIYGTLLFLVYTGKMAVTLSFPLEFEMLRREHFNHWYSLGPYFLALILVEIPMQIFCTLVFMAISYPLTGQPLETERILAVFVLCVMATLASQGFGFLIGITSPIKIAVFIGPVIVVVLSMFGFNIFYRDIPVVFRWLYHISYFRAAYHSTMFSLYHNRSALPCPPGEFYCHYNLPSKFLQDMDILGTNVPYNMIYLMAFGTSMYVLTVFAVWWRLNRR